MPVLVDQWGWRSEAAPGDDLQNPDPTPRATVGRNRWCSGQSILRREDNQQAHDDMQDTSSTQDSDAFDGQTGSTYNRGPSAYQSRALSAPHNATDSEYGLVVVSAQPGAARFRSDQIYARTSGNAMDRYKSLVRLMSSLRREMMASVPEPIHKPTSWSSPANTELLGRVIEVGETLALFGTADFGERSNSSRAINNKDYAYLLRTYGGDFWQLYREEFMDCVPLAIQDDMLTVRGLLATRFESNAIIQDALLRNVGLEPGAGGAMVINTSLATLTNTPTNNVQTSSASQVLQQGLTMANIGKMVGGLAGFWFLRRIGLLALVPGVGRIVGGRRGQRSARGQPLFSDEDEGQVRRGMGKRAPRGTSMGMDHRLLLAFDHVDGTWRELQKAQKNAELLRSDWRLGPMRLAAPFDGPNPPGYEPVDLTGCEPRLFMHSQLGAS
eukprot:CAMPEP_0119102152 /NCGR_PEP_ID=MMETSP1180-20130426/1001_1 /TAXON_ID=3052 ORGANISM="Chlamydomonas cf sp, Strain CCMP681" /NCGR_SAMPLE_ID=MMETSP1180 /ASSEMBLY_ACC=CAM_ASM_000741 /LENGTH=440 /DNA_ID=CAMNT_0007086391 /DNA_START=108 /DNA_END=1430 /DNA_ORIENTATION=-